MSPYPGPVRDEPLAIELHNTVYAVHGRDLDGLADAAALRAWLAAIADRLPAGATPVDAGRREEFVSLRAAVREALHAALERRAISDDALGELNRLAAGSPEFRRLTQHGRRRSSEVRYQAASGTDVVLGVIASSAIALVSGSNADALRACGAPGCVLMFLKDHPRREWCSATCGNRARQARHYARTRAD